MPGRTILSLSAIILFIAGGATLFAPNELARAIDPAASRSLSVIVQLLGSGFLGFALINWMSRGSRIGGIYARPLGMGNLLFFASAALTLGKSAGAAELSIVGIGVCAALAAIFAWLVFMHDPLPEVPTNTTD